MKRFVFCCMLACVLTVGCRQNDPLEPEPLWIEQWALHFDRSFYEAYDIDEDAHIHANKAMKYYSGKGVRIAIIDIGFDVNHTEYRNNIIATINSADGSADVSCNHHEMCYHGTAVAGLIASNINAVGLRGLAPQVELILIKLDLAGYVGDDEIIRAFRYAHEYGADIINCSWGTEDPSLVVEEYINILSTQGRDSKGIVVVFSAGNEAKELQNDESMLESVLGVGATDEENLRAVYSNYGKGLDLMAPGGWLLGITTTAPGNETSTTNFMQAESAKPFQGTSASAPLVSATVALMLEQNRTLSRGEIFKKLRQSADKIGSVPYENGHNIYYGYGKVHVDRAMGL